jgi:hypothetical protein
MLDMLTLICLDFCGKYPKYIDPELQILNKRLATTATFIQSVHGKALT